MLFTYQGARSLTIRNRIVSESSEQSYEESEEEVKDLVLIAKKECLSCSFLVGSLGKKNYPCIEEDYCPAHYYHITQGGKIQVFASKLASLYENPDLEEQAKITEQLKDFDPAVVATIYKKAKELLSSSATKY